jgi:tetratricopeptide (TPR) repeat protein
MPEISSETSQTPFWSAAHWLTKVGLVLEVLVIVYHLFGEKLELAALVADRWLWAGLVVGTVLFWLIARFPRIRISLFRLIFGGTHRIPTNPPQLFRGLQPYRLNENLPGRRADGEKCLQLLHDCPFLVLEGESGCGKSSLLNATLKQKAQELFTVVQVRVAENPYRETVQALQELADDSIAWPADRKGLAQAITAITEQNGHDKRLHKAGMPLLLCIDQFEGLFAAANEQVRRTFMQTLQKAIDAGQIRLLLVVRSDFSDLLVHLCQELDPNGNALTSGRFYILKAFTKTQALSVLHEIFSPLASESKDVQWQLDDFAEVLVNDLLRPPRDERLSRNDEKTVLPAELQIVGEMVESLGTSHFSSKSFRELGGRTGLLSLYVEQAKTYISRMGLAEDNALLILRELTPQTRTRSATSSRAIAEALSLPISQVTKVLDAFTDLRLVNRVPMKLDSEDRNADGSLYELMHEHLAQILQETPDPALRRIREAREGLNFWRQRTESAARPSENGWNRISNLFSQPLPMLEVLRLWRYARSEDRGMLLRSLRAFVSQFATVFVAASLIFAWTFTDSYQIRRIIADAPPLNPGALLFLMSRTGRTDLVIPLVNKMNDWIDIQWKAGYQKQAIGELKKALKKLQDDGETNDFNKFASVSLNAKEAEILFASGAGRNKIQSSLDNAQNSFNAMSTATAPALRFVAATRIGEAFALTSETQLAVNWWKSAFEIAKQPASLSGDDFISSLKGLAVLTDSHARQELRDEAVGVVRENWYPPENCRVLSSLAAEFYREGNALRAEQLWQEVAEAAMQFEGRQPPAEQSLPVYEPKRSNLREIIELPPDSNKQYQKARVLLGIGVQQFVLGRKEQAKEIWAKALDEGATIGLPPNSSDLTLSSNLDLQATNDESVLPFNQSDKGDPANVQRSNIAFSVTSPLAFYNEAAEDLYRIGAIEVEHSFEDKIYETTKKEFDPPAVRAYVLAVSAGRLSKAGVASVRAWNEALAAARQLENDMQGKIALKALPALPVAAQKGEVAEMQSAVGANIDRETGSLVFGGLAKMLFRQGSIQLGLQVVGAMMEGAARLSFLLAAADDLINKKNFDGAMLLINQLHKDVAVSGDDEATAELASSEARLGLFRRSRLTCPKLAATELFCYSEILSEYESRRDPTRFIPILEQYKSRYHVDW